MSIRWIFLIVLGLAPGAFAQTAPPTAPKASEEAMTPAGATRQIPATMQEGHVVKLDLEMKRLDLAVPGKDGKPEIRSFALESGTRVYRRAQQIILTDIKVGDRAKIQYTTKEGGMLEAKRIMLISVPAPPAANHAATKPR